MVMRATRHASNNILPSRTTATAECSSWLRRRGPELFRGLGAAGWLVEKALAERQGLVGADDNSVRLAARNAEGFLACQQRGDIARRGQAGGLLNRPLVDIGRNCLESNSGLGSSVCRERLCEARISG